MLSYYLLLLGLQSGFLPAGFPNNISVTFVLPPRKHNRNKIKFFESVFLFSYLLTQQPDGDLRREHKQKETSSKPNESMNKAVERSRAMHYKAA
jgi:hypothetical protein